MDLGHALRADLKPMFYRDKFPRSVIGALISSCDTDNNIQQVLNRVGVSDREICNIFWDTTSVCCVLQRGQTKLDPLDFQEIMISVLYRLSCARPPTADDPNTGDSHEELLHIGLLAFSSTCLFNVGPNKKLPYESLERRFRDTLLQVASLKQSSKHSLLFWLLFIGGISALRKTDEEWIKPQIQATATLLNIKSWESAKQHLSKYPWIDSWHDEPARGLWG